MRNLQNELVSVVVPVFNVLGYIDRCLASVTGQDYKNLQIVVVDDGSTDGSAEACEKWRSFDHRIEVFHTVNSGLSAARNFGMKYVRGSRVIFVDSDDCLGTHHIGRLVSALEGCYDPAHSVVITGFSPIAPETVPADDMDKALPPVSLDAAEAIAESVTVGSRFGAFAWGKLYPRALFHLLEYPVGRYYEDQFVTYKVFLEASDIVYLPTDDYYYTQERSGSISSGGRVRELDYLDAIRETLTVVSTSCPEAVPAVRRRYLGSLVSGVEIAVSTGEDRIARSLFEEAKVFRAEAMRDRELSSAIRTKYFIFGFGFPFFRAFTKMRASLSPGLASRVISKVRRRAVGSKAKKVLLDSYLVKRAALKGSVVFLVMTPRYKNFGDHLIALSEHLLLQEAGVSSIIEVPYEDCQEIGPDFRQLLAEGDSLLFTGGGYLGSLWPGLERAAEGVLSSVRSSNKVIFFPESIYYEGVSNYADTRLVRLIDSRPSQILLLIREGGSLARLNSCLDASVVRSLPDMGLFVRRADILQEAPERDSSLVLACLRHDKEGLQGGGFGAALTDAIVACGMRVASIDTHDPTGELFPEERAERIGALAKRFGEAAVVVTNRLHGMVLAMIMSTPCIVFDNVSNKLSGVAQWVCDDYPVVLADEKDVSIELIQAVAKKKFDGDVADLLSSEREALLRALREVA